MISKINLKEVASYNAEDHIMESPGRINFIFGANGSGKTTISRVLANPDSYPTCSVVWEQGRPQTCKVYNADFVEATFSNLSGMPGVFTLGQAESDIYDKISRTKELIEKAEDEKTVSFIALQGDDGQGGKKKELALLIQKYTDRFWLQKQKYDGTPLKAGLEGFLNSKERFREEIVKQYLYNKESVLEYDQLAEKATTVFGKKVSIVELIQEPDFQEILDMNGAEILTRKIVGKEDVDIGALVKKLGNSDWVKSGMEYLDTSDGICPFCQRPLEVDFKSKLEEYFDESYIKSLGEIELLKSAYLSMSSQIISQMKKILTLNLSFIANDLLDTRITELSNIFDENLRRIEHKRSNASSPIKLLDCTEQVKAVLELIREGNKKIGIHNEMVSNLGKEKNTLTLQIWRFITAEIKNEISDFRSEKSRIEKEIAELNKKTSELVKRLETLNLELRELQGKLTSVIPTRDAINRQLETFGYNGFRLSDGIDEHSYSIVRDNGQAVNKTLSEGEQNFITFLYFYSMLKGSLESSGTVGKEVVVIDDPVSSMDNDALFIISSLIRDLFDEICDGSSSITQMFVLSHNLYFYKEVSFTTGMSKKLTRQMKYWLVRKSGGFSSIECREQNPISSTYEVLWDEIKNATQHPEIHNSNGLQNTMRRILEHYYKYYGGISLRDIPCRVAPDYRWIVKSLISWTNAGSHSSFDDVCCSPLSEGSVEIYLEAFRIIFEEMGHIAHYNMMMDISEESSGD